MTLNIEFNLGPESDALFNELMKAHEELNREQSEQLNAGLILLLAGIPGLASLRVHVHVAILLYI